MIFPSCLNSFFYVFSCGHLGFSVPQSSFAESLKAVKSGTRRNNPAGGGEESEEEEMEGKKRRKRRRRRRGEGEGEGGGIDEEDEEKMKIEEGEE